MRRVLQRVIPRDRSRYAIVRLSSSQRQQRQRIFPGTTIPVDKSFKLNIDRSSKLIMIGSCFASNVAAALKLRKFQVYSNPQGIQFNPVSIAQTLKNCTSRYVWTRGDLSSPGRPAGGGAAEGGALAAVRSFSHHSSFSALAGGAEAMLADMTQQTSQSADALLDPHAVLFVTLGTTKIYQSIDTNQVVSNCHKEPNSKFTSRFLSAAECTAVLEEALLPALRLNAQLKVVLTVSPVRHTRDGVVASSAAKAGLLCAAGALVQRHPDRIAYFPAYEIMMVS
jgi:hypothetical protein